MGAFTYASARRAPPHTHTHTHTHTLKRNNERRNTKYGGEQENGRKSRGSNNRMATWPIYENEEEHTILGASLKLIDYRDSRLFGRISVVKR